MKKIIVFLLTAVLCLATLSIGMAADEAAATPEIPVDATEITDSFRTGEHAKIYPIEKYTPVIDGTLDAEYKYSQEVTLRHYEPKNPGDPAFATASIYYLWDDTALYFYVDVQDTTLPDSETAINHESDCIEMLFSVYNYDPYNDNIKSKQASDIGDSQFRVMRTKDLSMCENLVDTDVKYGDGSHGGFGKWVFDNTDWDNTAAGPSYIIHENDNDGYRFEGFVRWSDDLLAANAIYENVIIGLGIQVNDDINGDSKRDEKLYAINAGPQTMSMSGNRATCGMFRLVNNGKMPEAPETPDAPGTADPSVIFALLTVVSAGGFTVFAAKKAKND